MPSLDDDERFAIFHGRSVFHVDRRHRSGAGSRDLVEGLHRLDQKDLDNFERALQVEPKTDEGISILKGMDMVYRSLVAAAEEEGLSAIEAEGKEFDPNFHQAVMQEKDESKPSGIVLAELQKGYMLKDRILRPTMVKVNE